MASRSCQVYLSNRHKMFNGLTVAAPLLDDSSGVNTESILQNKEETKAFWVGKMQLEEPTTGRTKTNQQNALSPPPGFDNESSLLTHQGSEDAEEDEQSLSNDEFINVAEITVLPGPVDAKPVQQQPKYFGSDEDSYINVSPQQPVETVKPKVTYFPSSRSSEYSDDDDDDEEEELEESANPTETLIEREIRLQREREESLKRERGEALEAMRKKVNVETPVCFKPAAVDAVKKTPESKKVVAEVAQSAEDRISEEIRELKQREEELILLRSKAQASTNNTEESLAPSGTTDDEGLHSDSERDMGSSDANSSRVESPEAGLMGYSTFTHQRAPSLDSMSSGHSSGDHGSNYGQQSEITSAKSSRKFVKPYEDPSDQEETPVYPSQLNKETPIEREIRLAREREEALRKENREKQGLKTVQPAVKPSANNKESRQQGQRLANGNGDSRDVRHRYATSIIQREIEEVAERENELVRKGIIQTTSLERSDNAELKVNGLSDYTKKEVVKTQEPSLPRSQSVTEEKKERQGAPTMRVAYNSRNVGSAQPPAVPATSATWRSFSNPQGGQRGLMEKFIQARGRLVNPVTFTAPTPATSAPVVTPGSSAGDPVGVISHTKPAPAPIRHVPISAKPAELVAIRKDEVDASLNDKPAPPRRHYATTEEKIQQEFREMQKREEELKLTRSKMFAKSQPNLLDLDDERVSEPEQRVAAGAVLRGAHSISDLLADEPLSMEAREAAPAVSSTVKGARRKSALIAQWENRIHQQDF